MSNRYQDAIDYLYGLVNFEHKRLDQYVAENISLDRPRRLLALVGDPQDAFPTIHIAGTKGKGSVAAMCTAILRAAGYRAGLYTSPHLFDFRDRIRILSPEDGDGRIGKERLVELVEILKPAADQIADVTWYEAVTALAFMHFAREKVDVAVVEVGLGGRLDATNVLSPLVSVITSLSLDHTALLGDTLPEIAAEKGGIIKDNTPVITAPQATEALDQLQEIADSKSAPMTVIGQDWQWTAVPEPEKAEPEKAEPEKAEPEKARTARPSNKQQVVLSKAPGDAFVRPPLLLTLALAGLHQRENSVCALAALNEITGRYPLLNSEAVIEGMANVDWPGRLQILSSDAGGPTVLADCAHNVDSANKLVYALSHDYEYAGLTLVLGITADKDMQGILEALLPLAEYVVMTTSGHPRAASPAELADLARDLGVETITSPSVSAAIRQARRLARPEDLICVTGSIFVVGDLLNHWDSLQSEL